MATNNPAPNETPLLISTPAQLRPIFYSHAILAVIVALLTATFQRRGVMDSFQIMLCISIFILIFASCLSYYLSSKDETRLYASCFQLGGQTYDYDGINRVKLQNQQITFFVDSGRTRRSRRMILAANAGELYDLIVSKNGGR